MTMMNCPYCGTSHPVGSSCPTCESKRLDRERNRLLEEQNKQLARQQSKIRLEEQIRQSEDQRNQMMERLKQNSSTSLPPPSDSMLSAEEIAKKNEAYEEYLAESRRISLLEHKIKTTSAIIGILLAISAGYFIGNMILPGSILSIDVKGFAIRIAIGIAVFIVCKMVIGKILFSVNKEKLKSTSRYTLKDILNWS
jgi:DNA-directed RNA polymerase subunit RPC12/RpoP